MDTPKHLPRSGEEALGNSWGMFKTAQKMEGFRFCEGLFFFSPSTFPPPITPLPAAPRAGAAQWGLEQLFYFCPGITRGLICFLGGVR